MVFYLHLYLIKEKEKTLSLFLYLYLLLYYYLVKRATLYGACHLGLHPHYEWCFFNPSYQPKPFL